MDECLFCNLFQGKIPTTILYKDDDCFVIKDINPVAPTHLLVIPVEHMTYIEAFSDEEFKVITSMFMVARNFAISEGISDSGYRLTINQKEDAGQQVPHLHLHLIGGDNLSGIG